MDPETIKTLTEEVLALKADRVEKDQIAQAAVHEAKEAADRAVQVAEEARYEYEAAAQAYQAKKAELQAAIASLDDDDIEGGI